MTDFASAQANNSWQLRTSLSVLNSTSHTCDATAAPHQPACSTLTDDFCDSLWSPKNDGHMKTSDGEILVGKTGKSETERSFIANLRALIDSQPRLPADLRKVGGPILADLKATLAKEKDSPAWYRELALVQYRWNNAVDDVATARTETRLPRLKPIKSTDLKTEEAAEYANDNATLKDQILDAKYATSSNWARVQSVFGQAIGDLKLEIAKLNVSDDKKAAILKKVSTIQLSLPYSDHAKLGANESCGSSETNAFYEPTFHKFTVCAGLFNSFRSESSLYMVIAHEISHSFDSNASADDELDSKSALSSSLKKLAGAKGAVYSCSDWSKVVSAAATVAVPPTPPKFDPLQPLYDCLKPKINLLPYDPDTFSALAASQAKREISRYASANSFLKLAQPTLTKKGQIVANEFFMRPDRLAASDNDKSFATAPFRDANTMEIFTQALSCATVTDGASTFDYKTAPEADRPKVFTAALTQTQAIVEASNKDSYSYCGRNCDALQAYQQSANSGEDFADWMAFRALGNFIKRKPDLSSRREAMTESMALFCREPGVVNDAPSLALAEKGFSLEEHPDDRARRISSFNPINAALAHCTMKTDDPGSGKCAP